MISMLSSISWNQQTFSCRRIKFILLMSFVPVDWRHYIERKKGEREREKLFLLCSKPDQATPICILQFCTGFIIDSQHSNPIILEYYLFANQMLHLIYIICIVQSHVVLYMYISMRYIQYIISFPRRRQPQTWAAKRLQRWFRHRRLGGRSCQS